MVQMAAHRTPIEVGDVLEVIDLPGAKGRATLLERVSPNKLLIELAGSKRKIYCERDSVKKAKIQN